MTTIVGTEMAGRRCSAPGRGRRDRRIVDMDQRTCTVDGCGKRVNSRGLCAMHYKRIRVHGEVGPAEQIKDRSLEVRLHEKISKGPRWACWEFTGAKSKGYGTIHVSDVGMQKAYRVMYEMCVGPIPEGLVIDHLCRNPSCVNPWHIEPVTQRENVLRGEAPAARAAKQTHCIRGHEFSPSNTYRRRLPNGQIMRVCRTCKRQRG